MSTTPHPSWIITPQELRTCMDSVTLLDVREPSEYAESHLKGCTLIPLGDLMVQAEQRLKKNDDLVVYCAHGVRSLHAITGLKQLGFTKLRSLEGGLAAFEELYGRQGS